MLLQNEGVNNKGRRHEESQGSQFRECQLECSDHLGKTGTGQRNAMELIDFLVNSALQKIHWEVLQTF